MALLSGHFAAPQSVTVRRIIFRQCTQRLDESVHHFVVDLWGLASLCKFGTLEEEMIMDQLEEHTTSSQLQEKLFMSPDNLTLSKAVKLAFQFKSAAQLTLQLAASGLPSPCPAALAQTVKLAWWALPPLLCVTALGVSQHSPSRCLAKIQTSLVSTCSVP